MSADKKKLNLGVAPIGKFVFSHKDALLQKNKLFKKLRDLKVDFTHIDEAIPDGMVRDQAHVKPVVDYLRSKKVDALFIPHCNFGTEGAAASIAKKLNLPTLLWGPRDEAPLSDGSRLRDSLCGMFATSKVLGKLKVPFTYIENTTVDDDEFKKGLNIFLGAARAAKAIKGAKIAQIGVRIDFFWTTIINESELLDKFSVEVLPVDMYDFIAKILNRYEKDKPKYIKELSSIKKWLKIEGLSSDEPLLKSLAMRDELLELALSQDLSAISIKSFSSLQDALGGASGLAEALVQEDIPVIDESDLHGAITSVILEAAAGSDSPSFFPDITARHPSNDNGVLLWHGTAPLSLKDPKSDIVLKPPWILKGLPPSNLSFKLKDGPLTIARFDSEDGKYRLGFGQGHTTIGPTTNEFHTWMEVDDWPLWEKKLIYGPYIHHASAVYGHYGSVLEEACKYVPALVPERFGT